MGVRVVITDLKIMADYHEETKLFTAFGPLERRNKDKICAVRLEKPSQKI
jgi:hypothetical protein